MSTPSPSLSRRERERLRRRKAMLRAAQSVFAEKGYARATLDEIAERAEFGKGTLYNYFEGGKEDILFAIFSELYDEVCDLIRRTVSPETGPTPSLRDAYHRLVTELVSFFQEREDLFVILIREGYRLAFSDDADKARYFHEQHERMVNALMPAIDRAKERGTMRSLPAHNVAHMLLENLDGMMMHWCLAERSSLGGTNGEAPATSPVSGASCPVDFVVFEDPEAVADFLTTLLFDGLQAAPHGDSSLGSSLGSSS